MLQNSYLNDELDDEMEGEDLAQTRALQLVDGTLSDRDERELDGGSAALHGDMIRDRQAHVVALQEIKCDQAQLLAQMFESRKKGWEWTNGQALRRKSRAEAATDGSEGDLGWGGTGIGTKSPLSQTLIRPKDDAERELYDTGRWCGSEVPVAAATVMMLLHCFYGVAGSSLSKRRENERWLRALLELLKNLHILFYL